MGKVTMGCKEDKAGIACNAGSLDEAILPFRILDVDISTASGQKQADYIIDNSGVSTGVVFSCIRRFSWDYLENNLDVSGEEFCFLG
jgi:hypothetical protein